jgi:CheY-like chemotaxis protein
MYRVSLEKLGYKVTAHRSSEKTLELFRSAPDSFDLIITDQTMPNLPGSELAKQILQIRGDIPIILCTGYSSMISEEKADDIGIARFLMKPVDRQDLAKTVREVLDS